MCSEILLNYWLACFCPFLLLLVAAILIQLYEKGKQWYCISLDCVCCLPAPKYSHSSPRCEIIWNSHNIWCSHTSYICYEITWAIYSCSLTMQLRMIPYHFHRAGTTKCSWYGITMGTLLPQFSYVTERSHIISIEQVKQACFNSWYGIPMGTWFP